MVGISIDQIISVLASVPFLGRRLLGTALDSCSQRHRCDSCGETAEVIIGDIVKNPLALLSEVGFERHSRHFSPTSANQKTDEGGVTFRLKAQQQQQQQQSPQTASTSNQTSNNGAVACPKSPTSRTPPRSPTAANGEQNFTSASNESSSAPEKKIVVKKRVANAFACLNCPEGRLGIHCFLGDSTNGDKKKLMERIQKVFTAMPEVIETSMDPSHVKNFQVEDVFWVD